MKSINFFLILQVLSFGVIAAMARPQGTGQISQFHYRNGAGENNYGFVNGLGHYQKAQRLANGDVVGEYGYIDGNGTPVHVQYTAGAGGYVASRSNPSAYNPNAIRNEIPSLTSQADLSAVNWETSYDFTHSNDRSFPNSDLLFKTRTLINEPQNNFDGVNLWRSGPINK